MRKMILASTLLLYGVAIAAPTNDTFTNAIPILSPFGSSPSIDTSDASVELDEPDHAGSGASHSIWWEYTATTNGILLLDTWQSDENFDSTMGVYTGNTVNALSEIASNDDGDPQGTALSKIIMEVDQGTTYRIAIDGYGGDTGQTILTWRWVPSESAINDHFTDAIPLDGMEGTSSAINSRTATAENNEPDHADNGAFRSVWWKFTAPNDGTLSVDSWYSAAELDSIDPDDTLDTTLGVYKGNPNSISTLKPIASNDDSADSFLSKAIANTYQGETYWIAIDGINADNTGYILLNWSFASTNLPPKNDLFEEAIIITNDFGFSDLIDTSLATAEPNEPAHANNGAYHSIWWQYTAPTNGLLIFDTLKSNENFDTLLGVYSGSSLDALTEVASNDNHDAPGFFRSKISFQAIQDTVYWIAADGFDGASGNAILSWEISTNLDYDDDGSNNEDELFAGTDPTNPDDFFAITSINGNTVYFNSLTERFYSLYSRTSLMEGSWTLAAPERNGINGPDSLTSTNNIPSEFLKVEVSLPPAPQ